MKLMRHTGPLGLAAILLAGAFTAFAQEPRPVRYFFREAAQDGQGTVWGIYNKVYFFDGNEWKAAPEVFAVEDAAKPMRLTRLQDGSMTCVWQLSRERIAVTS